MKVLNAPKIVTRPHEEPGYKYANTCEALLVIRDSGEDAFLCLLPAYFCNGFSIPPWMPKWLAGDPWQRGWEAAVWHDYMKELLYADTDDELVEDYCTHVGEIWWTEKEADQIFRLLCSKHNLLWWRRRPFYWAVRAGNWFDAQEPICKKDL